MRHNTNLVSFCTICYPWKWLFVCDSAVVSLNSILFCYVVADALECRLCMQGIGCNTLHYFKYVFGLGPVRLYALSVHISAWVDEVDRMVYCLMHLCNGLYFVSWNFIQNIRFIRYNIGYCNAERYKCPPNEQCKYYRYEWRIMWEHSKK